MSVPRLPYEDFTCTEIARLLADKLTPDFNFKEQLWFVARADEQEAAQYLCLLLRTQFGFKPGDEGETFFHDCLNDREEELHRPFSLILYSSNAKDIARRALVLRDARQRLQNDPSHFPFLELPFEIRLRVYKFVFINNQLLKFDSGAHCSMADGSEVHVRSGIFGTDINTALLLTNQQIFDEAEPILYQTRAPKIGVHLREGLHFLRSLSPRARQNIRAVQIALSTANSRGASQRIEFNDDEKAWYQLCYYISQNLRLRVLYFDVYAGPPPANFVDAAWVKYLIMIRGLEHLRPKISFPGLYQPVDSPWPELDPELKKGLNAKRQALISFLKSEMC